MSLIVWKDWAKDATIADNSFGTSVINSIDFRNVVTRQVGKVARWQFGSESPDTQRVRLDFDFGAAKDINFVALLGWAGTTNKVIQVDLGTSSGASDVYNGSDVALWTPGTNDPNNHYLPLGATYSARYARVEIGAYSNETVDIGRIWIGESWATNCSLEFSMSIMDRGTLSTARAGSVWASDRQKVRQLNCRYYGLSDADFFGTPADFDGFQEMDMEVGQTGEVIVIPRNDDAHERHRLGVYGHLSRNGPIQVMNKTSGGLFTEKRITVTEER